MGFFSTEGNVNRPSPSGVIGNIWLVNRGCPFAEPALPLPNQGSLNFPGTRNH